MENASKALLMAGGVLLVMLVIMLFLFSWGKYSEFYTNKDDLAEITNIAEFNLQFTNYENRDVYGYELISLANNVADYNMRHSNATDAENNEKYNPIKLSIVLSDENIKKCFWYGDGNYTPHLFSEGKIEQSGISNRIQNIISTVSNITKFYRNENTANKLAKSINSLILYDKNGKPNAQLQYNIDVKGMTEEESREGALTTYKSITNDNTVKTYDEMVNKVKNTASIYQYYEYSQFKKGIFECTGIEYDDATGRVRTINFNFTGKIK